MRKFFVVFWAIGCFLLLIYEGGLRAQALTLGTVFMKGDVRVEGPGGPYTGEMGNAPLFPTSRIEVGKGGGAVLNVAGKGTIVANSDSVITFDKEGMPKLEKGTFEIIMKSDTEWKLDTPRGVVKVKAGTHGGIYTFNVKSDRVEVVVESRDSLVVAKKDNMVYKYDEEKKNYVLVGKKYETSMDKLLLTARKGIFWPLPVALGAASVAGTILTISANNTHHHRKGKEASPSRP